MANDSNLLNGILGGLSTTLGVTVGILLAIVIIIIVLIGGACCCCAMCAASYNNAQGTPTPLYHSLYIVKPMIDIWASNFIVT